MDKSLQRVDSKAGSRTASERLAGSILREYGPKKIAFYVVYAMKDLSESDARQHARAYGYSCPAIIDRRHELVDAVSATVTPEFEAVDSRGS